VGNLSVFKVKKETKKGKEHEYWHVAPGWVESNCVTFTWGAADRDPLFGNFAIIIL
jgi:hypothetical protein